MADQQTRAVDPHTGRPVGPAFADASPDEVRAATAAALRAHDRARTSTDRQRAGMLAALAAGLRDRHDELVATAEAETALGTDRLAGEVERTAGQLEAFADLVAGGTHHEAIIDLASSSGPDLRRTLVGIGPVAVFGASNFPLAFGVLGGDTASALAAGCAVVAKAHPSHPGTSQLCAEIAVTALRRVEAPPGLVGLVHGAAPEVGGGLVRAPEVRAVGFTGSLVAGRALHDLAAARPDPIPVYAEMGSLNPAFVLPEALGTASDVVLDDLAGAVSRNTGQFCTKPGVVVVPRGEQGEQFTTRLAERLQGADLAPVLNGGVRRNYLAGVARLGDLEADLRVTPVDEAAPGHWVGAAVAVADARDFVADPRFHEEVFGPAVVVVRADPDDYARVAAALPGCLAGSVHGTDTAVAHDLLDVLVQRCGRVVWNAATTGLAVTAAQNHTGPYPATTASGHTSVGTTAIRRFQRPVAYQAVPQSLLPPVLRDDNPWRVARLVDGAWRRDAISA